MDGIAPDADIGRKKQVFCIQPLAIQLLYLRSKFEVDI
jgi:hypothetical protein